MPCIPIPKAPRPPIPVPFSVPPLPPPPAVANPDLCCQTPDVAAMIASHLPPITLPPGTINPATVQAIVAALREATTALDTALDGVIPDCPRQ